ncbi:MAG: hypothetical protein K2Y37_22010 [Pirellulales bacterium]|nr:hypothetical protein [Pirellulales bacterium]
MKCEGWWEQAGFGRQPMSDLQLQFDGDRISGSGSDIIGPFELRGVISPEGQVAIVKQYVRRHAVEYRGTLDGEGAMWGQWYLGLFAGRWAIRMYFPSADFAEDAAEIGATCHTGVQNA